MTINIISRINDGVGDQLFHEGLDTILGYRELTVAGSGHGGHILFGRFRFEEEREYSKGGVHILDLQHRKMGANLL